MENKTITLTFGEAGENHVGMEMFGKLCECGSGFTCMELKELSEKFNGEYYNLNANLDIDTAEAGIVIFRNYLNEETHKLLFDELNNLDWDAKYFDIRRQKVLNKLARTNLLILDGIEREPDYKNKQGRIINSYSLPIFNSVKQNMIRQFNEILHNKCNNMICEGNNYYNSTKCGIGFHGDSERRKVIALRLGNSMKICWQWYHNTKPVGNMFEFNINGGDLYIMSEKAVGNDWKKRSIYALRHSAGCSKYTTIKTL